MDAFELLKGWPGWANANAEKVLASPAWRMGVEYDGRPFVLRCASGGTDDLLWLDITLDDERHVLGVPDCKRHPDLHLLWARRGGLPSEVLLALVERECGALFQMIENATGKTFAVEGVASGAPAAPVRLRTFALQDEAAAGPELVFALDLTPSLVLALGQLKHIDTGHPQIRGMVIEAMVERACLDVPEAEMAQSRPGDFLLADTAAAKWCFGARSGEGVRIVDRQAGTLTFGQIADGEMPAVPAIGDLHIVWNGQVFAEGVPDRVGGASAIRIVNLVKEG